METLSKRLKELRSETGKSQKKIGELLGIPQRTYASYEMNESQPSAEMLVKLSDLYEVSTDYLLGKTDVKATQNEVDFLNEIKEKGIDQLIRDYNLTLGDEAMDKKEERILIKLIKSFMENE